MKKHSLVNLAKGSLRGDLLPVQELLHGQVITMSREPCSRQGLSKIKWLEAEAS